MFIKPVYILYKYVEIENVNRIDSQCIRIYHYSADCNICICMYSHYNEDHNAGTEVECKPGDHYSDRYKIYSIVVYRRSKLSQCFVNLEDMFIASVEPLHKC